MHPILARFSLGEHEVALGSYSTFYTLAWLLAPLVAAAVAHRRHLPWRRVLALYYLALAAGIVGARVLDLGIAWSFYAQEPSRIWSLNFQGFSLYGGFVVATFTGIALARIWRLPVWRLADCAAPGLAVGIVLMRTGCFLRGCCFGIPTARPWGVAFPVGSPAWNQQLLGGDGFLGIMGVVEPVHPTQLYEIVAALVLLAIVAVLIRRHLPDGVAFLSFALGFTLFRLLNGLLRARQSVITAPPWFYPVFYLTLAGVLSALIVLRMRTRPDAPTGPASPPAGPPPLPPL